MKHTLLALLLFLSFGSFSQNYKGVVLGDTTYYTGGDFLMPFPYQDVFLPNLLRTIWIKDAQLIGMDSIFSFYPSVRRDYNTMYCLDTAGSTWLGKGFTRKPDGTEIYKNLLNQEITIRTLASLNDTWKITTDSNGIEMWGTVSQLNIAQIDNTTDSIKEITLQAMVAGMPVAHFHNGKKMILSKEHGFYRMFEFYYFPYYDPWGSIADYFPMDTSTYTRVNRDITLKDHGKLNFQTMFSPGTKWQYIDSFMNLAGGQWNITSDHVQDSIESKTFLGVDSIAIKKHRITVRHGGWGTGPTPTGQIILLYISTTNSIVYDTLTSSVNIPSIIRNYIQPEYTYSEPWQPPNSANLFNRYRLTTLTDSIQVLYTTNSTDFTVWYNSSYSCITPAPLLSGNYYKDYGFVPNAYFMNRYRLDRNGLTSAIDVAGRRELYYYQDGTVPSQTWGTPLNMIALSTEDISSTETPIGVSPNPSFSGVFKINSTEELKWEVYDLNGRKITQGTSSEINLKDNTSGMYLLKVISKERSYFSKLVR